MLLDRKRIKFWQRWIFGFMAFLMASFLIVGYSGVLGSCQSGQGSSSNPIDQQLTAAQAAITANPKDPAALLSLAQAYQARALSQVDGTKGQQADLGSALTYYKRYLALPDKALGVGAKQARVDALTAEVLIFTKLKDSAGVVTAYNTLVSLQPANAMNYLYLGLAAADAGQTQGALLAFGKFLKLSPNSQYAAQVKQRIAQLEATLNTPTPVPSPSPTKTQLKTPKPSPSPSPSK